MAGLAAALALRSLPHGSDELIALAAPLEGHPDNVAAAIAGGFTLALDGEQPLLRRIEPPPGLAFVLVVPDHELCTTESRKHAAPRGAAGRRRLQPAAHRAARARALDAVTSRASRARSTIACTSPTGRR